MKTKANENRRFTDDWSIVTRFTDYIIVKCPACSAPATTTGRSEYTLPWRPHDRKLVCTHCGHSKRNSEARWDGPVVATGRRSCGQCGQKDVRINCNFSTPPNPYPEEIDATCPRCNQVQAVTASWHCRYFSGKPNDPFMGLPLFMATDFRGHDFWAYNLDHVGFLERYISSELRERVGYSGKYAVITNLPTWMKLAKNREGLLKDLSRMRESLEKLS